jgi:hypothetical protein
MKRTFSLVSLALLAPTIALAGSAFFRQNPDLEASQFIASNPRLSKSAPQNEVLQNFEAALAGRGAPLVVLSERMQDPSISLQELRAKAIFDVNADGWVNLSDYTLSHMAALLAESGHESILKSILDEKTQSISANVLDSISPVLRQRLVRLGAFYVFISALESAAAAQKDQQDPQSVALRLISNKLSKSWDQKLLVNQFESFVDRILASFAGALENTAKNTAFLKSLESLPLSLRHAERSDAANYRQLAEEFIAVSRLAEAMASAKAPQGGDRTAADELFKIPTVELRRELGFFKAVGDLSSLRLTLQQKQLMASWISLTELSPVRLARVVAPFKAGQFQASLHSQGVHQLSIVKSLLDSREETERAQENTSNSEILKRLARFKLFPKMSRTPEALRPLARAHYLKAIEGRIVEAAVKKGELSADAAQIRFASTESQMKVLAAKMRYLQQPAIQALLQEAKSRFDSAAGNFEAPATDPTEKDYAAFADLVSALHRSGGLDADQDGQVLSQRDIAILLAAPQLSE